MTRNSRWTGVVALALMLGGAPASSPAQFYGGGYWGGGYGGGGQTVAGNAAQGAAAYAMGAGRYNVETAQANSINADTAMRWNQYVYNSRIEGAKVYHERLARDDKRGRANGEAVRLRLRNNPDSVDIAKGDALNVALDELIDPKVFPKATYAGGKVTLGGSMIRDIPFAYASAAISVSAHQLMEGGPPACLKTPAFAADRARIKPVADELRKQGAETGQHDPATIEQLKGMILALRAQGRGDLPEELEGASGRREVPQVGQWAALDAGDARRQRPARRGREPPRGYPGRPPGLHGRLQPPIRGRRDPPPARDLSVAPTDAGQAPRRRRLARGDLAGRPRDRPRGPRRSLRQPRLPARREAPAPAPK